MIETDTHFEDSGYDCDHCGGQILLRTDTETGQPDVVCYQCAECGCQWTLDGDPLRVGSGSGCKKAMRAREDQPAFDWQQLSKRSLWILLAILAGVALLRFGGFALLRGLLPLVVLIVAGVLLVRYGRTQQWW